MEAVCLTGSDVFKSGLPLKEEKTQWEWEEEDRVGGGRERKVSACGHVGQRIWITQRVQASCLSGLNSLLN